MLLTPSKPNLNYMGGMARLPRPLGGGRMLIRLKFTCYVICSLSLVPLCEYTASAGVVRLMTGPSVQVQLREQSQAGSVYETPGPCGFQGFCSLWF